MIFDLEPMRPVGLHLQIKPITVRLTELDKIAEPVKEIAEAYDEQYPNIIWEVRRNLIVELAMTYINIQWIPPWLKRKIIALVLDIIRTQMTKKK